MPSIITRAAGSARGWGWAATIAASGPVPGQLWTWGQNNEGQLGFYSAGSPYSSPKQVGSLTNWTSLLHGSNYSTAGATNSSNKLYLWGANSIGQLGQGNTTPTSSPVQVGILTDWGTNPQSNATGNAVTLAVKTDGKLWAWGQGIYWQLGQGNTTNYSSPKQIGSATNWASVAGGGQLAAAVKTTGSVWGWGSSSIVGAAQPPTQIGALTNWSTISCGWGHNLALKTDGTIWSWGANGRGQLGLGDTATRYSPVQIGTASNWLAIAASQYSSYAVKTDNTMWSFGKNQYGQLGLNNTSYNSSPVQIGLLTNWLSPGTNFGAQLFTFAIKTNNQLWAWGYNPQGQLGLGNTTYSFSSPVQVGALSTWVFARAGQNFGSGIKTP
jgi:alpha-tubulin suppressor-like RCC1 family protein